MRRVAGFLLVAVIALPIGSIAAPAGAAAGTSCKTMTGTATLSPPLPKLGAKRKVVSTVGVKGAKIGGCSGGGVGTATAALTVKFSKPGNCTTLSTGVSNPAKGNLTITWNTNTTSMIASVVLTGVPKKPTSWKIAGKIATGLFKGSKIAETVIYAPSSGGCTKTALSRVTFKQVTPLVIN